MEEIYCSICEQSAVVNDGENVCQDCAEKIKNAAIIYAGEFAAKDLYEVTTTVCDSFGIVSYGDSWEDLSAERKAIYIDLSVEFITRLLKRYPMNMGVHPDAMDVPATIKLYYEQREYKWPDVWQALGWAHTEMGEAYEVLLAKEAGWVRNNPEGKPKFDKDHFAEELGDAILMLTVAGMRMGVDPINAMISKMYRKMAELGKNTKI